ncbi:MAG: Rrf2 family transcriptional regulator [Elusimicrobia bacterium]|nr:Rrf2 family transcriptional regulator [Elusimicrobiota bacterium]
MTRCLNLTKTGEYAIAALSRLALDRGAPVSTALLAERQRVPGPFLVKILSQCARAGLVAITRGASGGVALAREPEKITLLEVIEACEGTLRRGLCVFFKERACAGPDCEVYCPLREEEERLRGRLASIPLSRMAGALSVHPNL